MKSKYIFIILGVVMIAAGTFLLSNENKNNHGNDNESLESIKIDTTNMEGDNIDTSNILDYAIENYSEGYINDSDLKSKNKYLFAIPSSAKILFQPSSYNKTFSIGDGIITANIVENTTVENLITSKIEEYDKLQYEKVQTFKSPTSINFSGFEISYFKISALNSYKTENDVTLQDYYDEFNLYIKEKDNKIIVISYKVINKKFTDELLSSLIKKIKIENGNANYLYSKISGDSIIGTLESIDPVKYKEYKVSYSIPKDKYYEKEDTNNTELSVNFASLTEDININFKLINGNLDNSFEEYANSIKDMYNYDSKVTRVDSFLTDSVIYSEKEYRRILMEYTDVVNDNTKHYFALLVYKIEDYMYYAVTIDSNEEILEENINDFLSFNLND